LNTDFARQQTDPTDTSNIPSKYETANPNQLALKDADNIDASYGGQSQVSKLSKKDAELSYIMQAIAHLDDSQRQDLLGLLHGTPSVQTKFTHLQAPNVGQKLPHLRGEDSAATSSLRGGVDNYGGLGASMPGQGTGFEQS